MINYFILLWGILLLDIVLSQSTLLDSHRWMFGNFVLFWSLGLLSIFVMFMSDGTFHKFLLCVHCIAGFKLFLLFFVLICRFDRNLLRVRLGISCFDDDMAIISVITSFPIYWGDILNSGAIIDIFGLYCLGFCLFIPRTRIVVLECFFPI